MSEFEKLLTSYQNRINSKLESLLPSDDSILSEAIRYSVLGGGKRLRPILVYLIGELGNAENDSLDIFISSIAITTFFVNNEEEYNALKSSGRMELINNEDLVKKLHDYYTLVDFVKTIDERIADASLNRFTPFMMDYADFHGYKKSRVVYDIYEVFELVAIPPVPKLRMFASNKFGVSERTSKRYLQLAEQVTTIRRMIRKELKS